MKDVSKDVSIILQSAPHTPIPEDWIPRWWHGEPIADQNCEPLYAVGIERDIMLTEWCYKYGNGK
jgi:hypothetical protein